jgi:hypothetical protein
MVYIRLAGPDDGPALTAALLEAVNWDGCLRFTPEQLLADPGTSHYVAGWPDPVTSAWWPRTSAQRGGRLVRPGAVSSTQPGTATSPRRSLSSASE